MIKMFFVSVGLIDILLAVNFFTTFDWANLAGHRAITAEQMMARYSQIYFVWMLLRNAIMYTLMVFMGCSLKELLTYHRFALILDTLAAFVLLCANMATGSETFLRHTGGIHVDIGVNNTSTKLVFKPAKMLASRIFAMLCCNSLIQLII